MDHEPSPASLSTAADVMTSPVVSVVPETSVRDVAKLLLEHRISAVPVMEAGTLLGILSEGDLLGRSAEDRLAGQEWWLAILSGAGQMEAAVTEAAKGQRAHDVMQAPVVTVDAATPVREVAELLRARAIKRVPVMQDGRVVGIVSRADLLRTVGLRTAGLGSVGAGPVAAPQSSAGSLADIIGSFFGGTHAQRRHAVPAPSAPGATAATAAEFRGLVEASVQAEVDEKSAFTHAADMERRNQVKTMLHDHLGTEMWDALMTHARVTAAHGGKEIELLRFPSDLCTDSGRKINNVDPAWPETLRGEPAEVHARWERELKPKGFGLAARVVDYPHGMPGNVSLVLVWES